MNKKTIIPLGGWSVLLFLISSFSLRIIPTVSLNGITGGQIKASTFSKFKKLQIHETRSTGCRIRKYTLYHISLHKSMEEIDGSDCAFSSDIKASILEAKKGDKYIFMNIQVLCHGDMEPFKVNHLNFTIK